MAGFYRRLWIFFAGSGIGLFIAYSQACKNIGLWFIIPASICLAISAPLILRDYRHATMENLRAIIEHKRKDPLDTGTYVAEEEKLRRLEQMNTLQWLRSWFRRPNKH